jgi:hypothetical protein
MRRQTPPANAREAYFFDITGSRGDCLENLIPTIFGTDVRKISSEEQLSPSSPKLKKWTIPAGLWVLVIFPSKSRSPKVH